MQQLNTRLDSALDYAGRGTQLRITRSELLLSALPTIASPGRSLQEPDARQSLAGSSRSGSLSAHRLQSVGEAATAPGTAAEAGPIGSPERWLLPPNCRQVGCDRGILELPLTEVLAADPAAHGRIKCAAYQSADHGGGIHVTDVKTAAL
jgi:hypothetical protein